MQFSRYLYERKEVEASFINTMLKKDTNHAIFWIMEFFLSGWHQETIDLIWQVYYDFYYVYNSTLERKLHDLLKVVPYTPSTLTLKSILIATNTLLSLKHSTHTFEMRMIVKNYPEIDINIIYKKLPKTYKKYKNKHFVRSVERGHIINVAHHLQLTGVEGLLPDIMKLMNVSVIKKLHAKNADRHGHMLVAKLNKCMWLKQNNGIKIPRIVLSELTSEQEKMINDETAQHSTNPSKVLAEGRKFAIDDDIGMDHFFLSRFNIETQKETQKERDNQVKHSIYFHWEYYAFETPIWRERFDCYKAFQNHETNEINFPTDEVAEEFYQKYGYEPDEQSRETDEKSTKDIEEISYDVWFLRILQYEEL